MSTGAARIPSLDGLRALSIGAVLLGHAAGTNGFPDRLTHVILEGFPVDIAQLGVRVFFVISGFLITGLLMNERREYGSISLKRFYLRRTLRIFPAYYVFLAVLGVLVAAGVLEVTRRDFIHAATYTLNYVWRSWDVGHLWSLAVEEQFYLLWPATVVALGMAGATKAAVAVLAVVPVIRVMISTFAPDWRFIIGTSFETTADALAMGCLLALTRDRLHALGWYRRVVDSRWIIPALAVIAVVLGLRYRTSLLLGIPLMNLAIALTVDRCVRRPEGGLGRVLHWRPLVFMGTLSYSLYLWQQIFLNRESDALTAAFPLNIVLAACAALLSFYMVEQPFLRARPAIELRLLGRRERAPRGSQSGAVVAPDGMPAP